MRKKIALVNQRYGTEVNGGSEEHCRQLAERLSKIYDVEIITTCALEYTTWDNYYPEGETEVNGIKVRRFKVEKSRNPVKFKKISDRVIGAEHTIEDEEEWVDRQGPYCPDCIEFLKKHASDYDTVIFMTYLYYLTVRGMNLKLKNAVLLPTAHDEPPIHLMVYRDVFENASAIIYNTVEERDFCEKKFDIYDIPNTVAGVGIEVPETAANVGKYDTGLGDYMLYIGRIDESKGCATLFRYFTEYKKRSGKNINLVLAGKSVMKIPDRKDIIPLGFVSEEEKYSLIKNCKFLVLASEFESLSMVVLESLAYGKPVLVNGNCKVLQGHCHRSNAGLYFRNYFEFEGAVDYLLEHPREYEIMGNNGKKYVDENYRWEQIIKKVTDLIESYKNYTD